METDEVCGRPLDPFGRTTMLLDFLVGSFLVTVQLFSPDFILLPKEITTMYAFIEGRVCEKTTNSLVLEAGGIGYQDRKSVV